MSDSSSDDVPYHSTPMEVEEITTENLSRSALLKKLNPQHKNRLFHKILTTKYMEHFVGSVVREYGINKDRFINYLVQLFVDISAYQYIDVKHYVKHNNLRDIVLYMEKSKNSILYTTGKYILKMPKYVEKCKKIGEFLESFIMIAAKEKILYDPSIYIIFEVVEKMSSSCLRPIKHTGVFIALKLQTGLIRIAFMFGNKVETYQHSLENETDPKNIRIFEHKIEKFYANTNSVNKLIEFIHLKIFRKNWNHGDSDLTYMRNACILEIANWIHIFPGRFLHNDCVDMLIESICDNNKMVRLTAVTLLSDILHKYHLKLHSKKIYKIIVEIGKRMNDVNINVAVKAIETLTSANKFLKLSHTIRDDICKLLYDVNYPIAAAASKFLIQRINEYITETNDREECLKMLVYFQKKSNQIGFPGKHPFVVETLIDTYTVLLDIPVYILILEKSQGDDESVRILIDFLTESVYQAFLGTCSLVRKKQIKRDVDPEKVKKITIDLHHSINKLTKLVAPLERLTPLLVLINEYGYQEYNNNKKTTTTTTNNNNTSTSTKKVDNKRKSPKK